MAITWTETDVTYGSSPTWRRCIGYEETSRTATSVTYKITLKLKVHGSGTSTSYYGYPVSWSVDGGSATQIKDSTRWYGNEAYRTFTKTITKSVGSSGGTTSFSVKVYATGGGSMSYSSSYSAKYSTWNTAPTWSSSARLTARINNSSGSIITNEINGTEDSIKIPENTYAIYLSWDSASDNEGNISRYELYTQIDNGSWTNIYSGSNRNYTHQIGSGGQGKRLDYYVVAVDSYGEKSGNLNLTQFRKNILTGATLSVGSSIKYDTSSIGLTWSGASNTNGNTSFTYSVSSSGITIHNSNKLTTSGSSIQILKSGTSTNAYILFDDLKKHVSESTSKTGSFNITLTTTNAYGTPATSTASVSVDLRSNPNPPTTVTIGGHVETSVGNFLIPSRQNPTISWSGASDNLGGSLTYEVYYKVDNGSEIKVSAGTSTSVSLKLSEPSNTQVLYARVVAYTSYGTSATSSTTTGVLYYYRPPSIALTNYQRTNSSASVDIYSSVNTSIEAIKLNKQSFTGNGVTSNFTGSKYTATFTGLNESSLFTVTATINDNSGLSSDVIGYMDIRPATPMFSVREKGVGVKMVNDGTKGDLVVGGTVNPIMNSDEVDGKDIDETPQGIGLTTVGASNDILNNSTLMHVKASSDRQFQLCATRSGGLHFRSNNTVAGQTDWKEVLFSDTVLNMLYPVGSIYMSTSSTNPSTYFGGTWERWGNGRVPVGVDTSQTEFNSVNKTGGAKTHTLTVSEMPSHTHTQNSHNHSQNAHTHTQNAHSHGIKYRGYSGVTASASGHVLLRRNATDDPVDGTDGDSALSTTATNQSTTATNNSTTATNQNTGGGSSHNNLQPYITCYMWRRTA